MKKFFVLMLALCMMLVVAVGCSSDEPEAPAPPPPPPFTGEPEKFLPNFTSVESEKMSSYINRGRYLITETGYMVGYGTVAHIGYLTHKVEDGEIVRQTEESEPNRKVVELDYENATCITEGPDGAFYFVSDDGNIIRAAKDGSEHRQIAGPGLSNMQIEGGKLYYKKSSNSHFFRADMDGSNETIILDKVVYYPYVIGNFVVYQDDDDEESLYLYNMNERSDKKLLQGTVYQPIVVGNWIFCQQKPQGSDYSQLVGLEFLASGDFEVHVFNDDDKNWYAGMHSLRYVNQRGYVAAIEEIVHCGTIVFWGTPTGNIGTPSETTFPDLEGVRGADAAVLMLRDDWRIDGTVNTVYSSPYGYFELSLDGNLSMGYYEIPIIMPDGMYQAEDGARIFATW